MRDLGAVGHGWRRCPASLGMGPAGDSGNGICELFMHGFHLFGHNPMFVYECMSDRPHKH